MTMIEGVTARFTVDRGTIVRRVLIASTARDLHRGSTNQLRPHTRPMITMNLMTPVMGPMDLELPMAMKVQRQNHTCTHHRPAQSASNLLHQHLMAFIRLDLESAGLTSSPELRCTRIAPEDIERRDKLFPPSHGVFNFKARKDFALIQSKVIFLFSFCIGWTRPVMRSMLVPVKRPIPANAIPEASQRAFLKFGCCFTHGFLFTRGSVLSMRDTQPFMYDDAVVSRYQ